MKVAGALADPSPRGGSKRTLGAIDCYWALDGQGALPDRVDSREGLAITFAHASGVQADGCRRKDLN